MAGGEDQNSFVTGMLAGLGMRELSQVLGLSRKRQEKSTAMPSAGEMLSGNMGDLDRIMLLSKLQAAQGGPGGMPGPAMPGAPGAPIGGAPMASPMPLPPPPAGVMPGSPVMPPSPGPIAMPPLAPSPSATPGGALPMALLMKMLTGAGGAV